MKKYLIIIVLLVLAKWWFTDPSITVPTNDLTFSYVVKYPEGVDKNGSLPMLVALHGNGDTPTNFYNSALNEISVPVRVVLLEGPLKMGSGYAWPWRAQDYQQYGKAISEAIELLTVKYPTIDRPILFGFSGGGSMAYYQAIKHGRTYSHIYPISGEMSEAMLKFGPNSVSANVHAFHGISDQVVSFGGGKRAISLLKAAGIRVKLSEYEAGHQGVFREMKKDITASLEQKIINLK